nr:MAG TPA: hypothetical protein [Caudoviricetes sp.]DAN83350.1 MAG TPA: hypothetical protein [Caudoviricetes sp.]DAV63076.1 MAG TPA: hypothetical protein [Caudoviricetes sp.]
MRAFGSPGRVERTPARGCRDYQTGKRQWRSALEQQRETDAPNVRGSGFARFDRRQPHNDRVMNKIKPLDRQSLIDVALQTSGSVEGALGMSIKNDIPVSGELAPDVELETAPVVDKLVLGRYEARGVRPATDISAEDLACVPYGGIGFMGIEIDFIVS